MRRSDPLRPGLFGIAWVLVFGAGVAPGCTPRCQESCVKVLDCGLDSTRVARDECVRSCQLEQDLYARWEDEAKEEAFKEHKRCVREASCEELADGVCYDEDLFVFDTP